MTHAELRDEERPPGWTVYVAELQCLLCGNLAGSIEGERTPLPALGMWQPADGGPPRMADWRQLRCVRCGGALLAESIDAVVRHTAVAEQQPRDVPRRGRPPKWLVEERRQRHEAAETRP